MSVAFVNYHNYVSLFWKLELSRKLHVILHSTIRQDDPTKRFKK